MEGVERSFPPWNHLAEQATLVFAGLCAQTPVLSSLLDVRETTEPVQPRGVAPRPDTRVPPGLGTTVD